MDLKEHFQSVLQKLSDTDDDLGLALSSAMLGSPSRLSTNTVSCFVTKHNYGSIEIQTVDLYAEKSSLQALGLLIFSVLVSKQRDSCVLDFIGAEKCNENSSLGQRKHLLIEKPHPIQILASSIESQVTQCCYRRQSVTKHPWLDDLPLDPWQLPSLWVDDLGDYENVPPRFAENDAIIGFGSVEGNVRLASLFLDLGAPDSDVLECCLEGEPGFRGVGPSSAELRIHLPGSFMWDSLE